MTPCGAYPNPQPEGDPPTGSPSVATAYGIEPACRRGLGRHLLPKLVLRGCSSSRAGRGGCRSRSTAGDGRRKAGLALAGGIHRNKRARCPAAARRDLACLVLLWCVTITLSF